jgi:hypothetical protein
MARARRVSDLKIERGLNLRRVSLMEQSLNLIFGWMK